MKLREIQWNREIVKCNKIHYPYRKTRETFSKFYLKSELNDKKRCVHLNE